MFKGQSQQLVFSRFKQGQANPAIGLPTVRTTSSGNAVLKVIPLTCIEPLFAVRLVTFSLDSAQSKNCDCAWANLGLQNIHASLSSALVLPTANLSAMKGCFSHDHGRDYCNSLFINASPRDLSKFSSHAAHKLTSNGVKWYAVDLCALPMIEAGALFGSGYRYLKMVLMPSRKNMSQALSRWSNGSV